MRRATINATKALDCTTTFFTTVDKPEPVRLDYWRRTVSSQFLHLECSTRSIGSFFGEVKATQIKDIGFTHLRSHQIDYFRTPTGIRDGKEKVLFVNFQLKGSSSIHQDGRRADLSAGDFACFDSTRPYGVCTSDSNEVVTFNVPCRIFVGSSGPTEQVTALSVRGDTKIGTLVSEFLRQVAPCIESVGISTAERLVRTSLDMVVAAFSDVLAQQTRCRRSSRITLLHRAKSVIDDNLSDPDLNPDKVARALGISKRYLRDLFREERTPLCKWIWPRRLERCCRDLSNPLLAGQTISQIAYNCGFSDMSHFCHKFKDAYFMTPTEFRRQQHWNV